MSVARAEWQQRRIGGIQMSRAQYAVLCRLAQARDAHGYLPVALDDVHAKTRNSLLRNDWIVISDWPDGGRRYRLTKRGEQALAVCSRPRRSYRRDGFCPRCGQRPTYTSPGRSLFGYCLPCHRQIQRERYSALPRVRQQRRRAASPASQRQKRRRLQRVLERANGAD